MTFVPTKKHIHNDIRPDEKHIHNDTKLSSCFVYHMIQKQVKNIYIITLAWELHRAAYTTPGSIPRAAYTTPASIRRAAYTTPGRAPSCCIHYTGQSSID